MEVEALSGALYYDNTKKVQKSKAEHANMEQATSNSYINITEVPAAAKTGNPNLLNKDQEKQQKEAASEQQIRKAISRANDKMKKTRTRCEFSYHEETKRVSIKVLDRETEEVIREIPPEETLEMVEKMVELAGILFDERR